MMKSVDWIEGMRDRMLSAIETEAKAHFEGIAKGWIRRFEISTELLSENDVLALDEEDRAKVWTARQDWVDASIEINGESIEYREGFPIVPGYDPGFDDYYLGKVEHTGLDSSLIFQELRFICSACEGLGEVEDDECESCFGDGEFVYDLDLDSAEFRN